MIELALKILSIIFPVFACVGVGAVYGKFIKLDMSAVNRLNIDVFTPFLMFWVMVDKPFEFVNYMNLMLAGAFVVLASGVILLPLVLLLRINWKTFLPPMMFTNSGNMGLPLILFAFGEGALQAAVLLFMVEMTLHFTIGLYMLDHKTRPWALFKMPIIQGMLLGVLFSVFQITIPTPIMNTIDLLAQVVIPLMLVSLGVRLLDVNFKDWQLGCFGAIAAPASGIVSALFINQWLTLNEMQFAQLIIFSALPPAVFNVLVAEKYQQEAERVASIVLLGNLGSVIAIPAVLWFVLPQFT